MAREITDRKRAERELAASERTLRGVFDGVRDAIFIVDRELRTIEVNEGVTRLLHVGREAALRLDIVFLIDQVQTLTEAIQALEQKLEGMVEQHPDAEIFRSLPVKGLVTTSALLAGFSERPGAALRHQALAARWNT